jgi:hypothetical protein
LGARRTGAGSSGRGRQVGVEVAPCHGFGGREHGVDHGLVAHLSLPQTLDGRQTRGHPGGQTDTSATLGAPRAARRT